MEGWVNQAVRNIGDAVKSRHLGWACYITCTGM